MALGEKARSSRDKVLNLLDDPAESVRQDTAVAIAKIDAKGESFSVLLKMLSDTNANRRRLAAVALDAFDTKVLPLSRELVSRLGDGDENVRYWLVIVVGNLKELDSRIPPILANILAHDASSFVRERAARELWEMAVDHQQLPQEATEALETAFSRDDSVGVRRQVAIALAAVDRTAYTALFRRCADIETGLLQKACLEALK
jgi:HEAT repeat protein